MNFKIWRSLTEPITVIGLTFEYCLLLGALAGISLSVPSIYAQGGAIVLAIGGLLLGVRFGRKDRRWYFVLQNGVQHFGIRILQKRRYVR